MKKQKRHVGRDSRQTHVTGLFAGAIRGGRNPTIEKLEDVKHLKRVPSAFEVEARTPRQSSWLKASADTSS